MMKYVVFESMGLEVAAVFSELVDHNSVVRQNAVILGAGMCSIEGSDIDVEVGSSIRKDVVVTCWGKSTSLNVMSRGEEDAALIKKEIQRTI